MAEIQLTQECSACHGTGIRYYNASPGGPLVEENPCLECGGDSKSSASFGIETTYFDEQFYTIVTKQQEHTTKLSNIDSQVGGLIADVGSLGDIVKEIYEIVQKGKE